jgi:hypothetical protein
VGKANGRAVARIKVHFSALKRPCQNLGVGKVHSNTQHDSCFFWMAEHITGATVSVPGRAKRNGSMWTKSIGRSWYLEPAR